MDHVRFFGMTRTVPLAPAVVQVSRWHRGDDTLFLRHALSVCRIVVAIAWRGGTAAGGGRIFMTLAGLPPGQAHGDAPCTV